MNDTQNLRSLISKRLQIRRAEPLYQLLCHQARETTHLCTYFRYESGLLNQKCLLRDACFFDPTKLPLKRSAIVFGSGPSALSIGKDEIAKLKENHLIVGFNFASLLDIPFDLYFFEAFGLKQPFNKVVEAASCLASEGTAVVFKSVWMHIYPSLRDLADLSMQDNFSLLRSYKLPSLCHDWIVPRNSPLIYLKQLFRPHHLEEGFYKEAFSTMLTILPIIKSAGIENIHLIGCDMNQDYFFRTPTYLAPEDKISMIPTELELPRSYNSMHVTGSHPVENVITMMPFINKLGLAKISVDCSVQGPLSKVLPRKTVY